MKKNEKKVIVGTIPATVKKNDEQPAKATAEGANAAEAAQPGVAPKAEQPTPEAPAKEETPAGTLFPSPTATQADTVLKLSRRIEELEQQLRREPQTIEERIMYYKRKQELTERYERFNDQIAHLDKLREEVAEANANADDFSDSKEVYRVRLLAPHLYRDEPVLSIANEALIDDVLDLLKMRMLNKAAELKAEISA